QAIAIGLSVDLNDEGGLELSVLLPNLHSVGQSSSSAYTICSATAHSFAEAIGLLRTSIPLTLNLAQLKAVIFSQEIAQSDFLHNIVSDMYLTHRLYNAAFCIVSIGEAKTMLEALVSAPFGARLSSLLLTSLENHTASGRIPDTHFSDFYYDMHSIYGSPIAILAATADGMHTRLTPEGRAGDALPGALPREGGSQNEYSGTALFRDQRMVGTLSSLETAWMNYLRGKTMSIDYSCEGTSLTLSPTFPPRVRIDTQSEQMRIEISARFTVGSQCSIDALTALIDADLHALISKCQSLGVDPFLFSQRAAASFPDIPSWEAFGYIDRYITAQVEIDVDVYMTTD
ncbi:MAG: Ger(x)C family spore germination C-terminal domain-containing protein, partial [Eubacteriales bacterium]|nr:Ger(x)C family spore germination C-terminal domain-containing protein [Eubacteriales bacterium]